MDQQLMVALAQSLLQASGNGGPGMRHKALPSGTPTTYYAQGSGGLFSSPALESPLISAVMLPEQGLVSLLPAPKPSQFSHPLYGIITGVTATTGSEPTGVCDDPPVAGLAKLCTHTAPFGRFSRMTRVFDADRIGETTNRGEHYDFRIINNPLNQAGWMVPSSLPMLGGMTNSEIAKAMFEFGVSWSRDFARVIYDGNPATGNTAGGGYKEFWGLDTLINTGYRDAETGVACPAADSVVLSFGNKTIAGNGSDIVRTITHIWRYLNYNAGAMGLKPVQWAISMRWGAFNELTEIWPCAYLTYRCQLSGSNQSVNIDGGEQVRMRDDMRNGQYLLIDGVRVPVAIDEAIAETEPLAGVFSSSMYFVPLTVLGGVAVTYLEYFNYEGANGTMDAIREFGVGSFFKSSDNGRFLVHIKPPNNFCIQLLAKTQPRLVLLAPFLAARLQHVRYTPVVHERESFTDSGYWTDGGATDRFGFAPSYYSPTA